MICIKRYTAPMTKGGFDMKYEKPELMVSKFETQPIASGGLGTWLENSGYEDAQDYITNFFVSAS